MSSTLTQIAQIETAAVTRPRAVTPVVRTAAVTALGYRATTGSGFATLGTTVAAGNWSAIRKPMSKVDFHDRWPLRSTL